MTVTAAKDKDGYATSTSAGATKTEMALRDVPQTINVVPAAAIRVQISRAQEHEASTGLLAKHLAAQLPHLHTAIQLPEVDTTPMRASPIPGPYHTHDKNLNK